MPATICAVQYASLHPEASWGGASRKGAGCSHACTHDADVLQEPSDDPRLQDGAPGQQLPRKVDAFSSSQILPNMPCWRCQGSLCRSSRLESIVYACNASTDIRTERLSLAVRNVESPVEIAMISDGPIFALRELHQRTTGCQVRLVHAVESCCECLFFVSVCRQHWPLLSHM